jgi:hypothetical protein
MKAKWVFWEVKFNFKIDIGLLNIYMQNINAILSFCVRTFARTIPHQIPYAWPSILCRPIRPHHTAWQ